MGFNAKRSEKIKESHRKQVRRVIDIKWPDEISIKKLYKVTKTKPLLIIITKRKWILLGHILRLPQEFTTRKSIRYYFEERKNKKFAGQ